MSSAPPVRTPRRLTRLAAALLALAMAAAARPATATRDPARSKLVGADGSKPNVLLVTVDTMRADHLGAYGYPLPTSPAFDRLAAEGVIFTDATTPVPTTAPALASLLTGRHADDHGVRENFGALPSPLETIAEVFAKGGYQTAGFYGNGAIKNGFAQGFGTFEPFAKHWFFHDDAGTNRALAWLAKAKEPWFLWIHYMNPHGPYNSSPPDRSAGFDYAETPQMLQKLPRAEQNFGFGVVPKYQQLRELDRVVDYVRRYDGEIVGTDAEIGRLRTALEESGALDHTLVVVTADHGESLGEDRYFFQHGAVLNEGSVRIPLLFRHPALSRGLRTSAPTSLIDLFPTLASLTGLPAPTNALGRDLTPALLGDEAGSDAVRIAYTVTPSRQTSVRRGPWLLRGTPHRRKEPDDFARLELFDTRTTPPTLVPDGEAADVRSELLPLLRATARQIRRNVAAPRVPSTGEKARLRALGYID